MSLVMDDVGVSNDNFTFTPEPYDGDEGSSKLFCLELGYYGFSSMINTKKSDDRALILLYMVADIDHSNSDTVSLIDPVLLKVPYQTFGQSISELKNIENRLEVHPLHSVDVDPVPAMDSVNDEALLFQASNKDFTYLIDPKSLRLYHFRSTKTTFPFQIINQSLERFLFSINDDSIAKDFLSDSFVPGFERFYADAGINDIDIRNPLRYTSVLTQFSHPQMDVFAPDLPDNLQSYRTGLLGAWEENFRSHIR